MKETIERFIVEEVMMGDRNTTLDPDKSLIGSGILDSLALLRLIAFIEDNIGIHIDDGEVVPDNFETLNVMTAFLESKQ